MYLRPADAPQSDDEWRAFLCEHDFGQLVAAGRGRDAAVIVPCHFAYDGRDTIVTHLVRKNPLWDALAENPVATMAVVGAYTYVPAEWNRDADESPEYGVPTSYYAAVQATGTCETVDDPDEFARLLGTQLAHFEPGGGLAPVEAGDNPYGRQLHAIRGVRLTIRDVRAKFKFGGNRAREHNLGVAERLKTRGAPLDLEARAHLLRRRGVAP